MGDNEKIREALAALDPSKDEDWTSAGLPAMAAVRALAGDGVTREQVEAAAPGFARDNLVLPGGELETASTEPTMTPPAVQPSGITTVTASVLPPETDLEAAAPTEPMDERAAAEAEMTLALAELDKAKAAALARMREAKAAADRAERAKEELRAAFNARFPPLSEAEKYQRYVQRQIEERQKRAEEERAALAILGKSAKSPLDRALAARRGYGLSRPRYPLVGGR